MKEYLDTITKSRYLTPVSLHFTQCSYTYFEKNLKKNADKVKIYILIIIIIFLASEFSMTEMDSPWTQYMNNNRVNYELCLFSISSGSVFAFY